MNACSAEPNVGEAYTDPMPKPSRRTGQTVLALVFAYGCLRVGVACVGDDPAILSTSEAGAEESGTEYDDLTLEPASVTLRPGTQATLTLRGRGVVGFTLEPEKLPDGGAPGPSEVTLDRTQVDLSAGTGSVTLSASADAQQQRFVVKATVGTLTRTTAGRVAGKPGTLDAFWKQQGIFDFDAVGECTANAVIALADGKFVVAGGITAPERGLFLARFSEEGALDTTFGGTGTGWVTFGNPAQQPRSPTMALLANGMIAVAAPSPNPEDFRVWLFGPDGTPSPAWNGKDGTSVPLIGANFLDNAIGAYQDRIVVAGKTLDGVAVLRYLANGTPDTTFGNQTGRFDFSISPTPGFPDVEALAIDTNGSIWIAGTATQSGQYTATVWRVDAAGTVLQANAPSPPGSGSATGMALQDGKAVVGILDSVNSRSTVRRFGNVVEPIFGGGSYVLLGPDTTGFARSMAVDTEKRILVLTGGYTGQAINLHRLLPSGEKDLSFGNEGLSTIPGRGYGLAMTRDGAIVVGADSPQNERKARIARLWL